MYLQDWYRSGTFMYSTSIHLRVIGTVEQQFFNLGLQLMTDGMVVWIMFPYLIFMIMLIPRVPSVKVSEHIGIKFIRMLLQGQNISLYHKSIYLARKQKTCGCPVWTYKIMCKQVSVCHRCSHWSTCGHCARAGGGEIWNCIITRNTGVGEVFKVGIECALAAGPRVLTCIYWCS